MDILTYQKAAQRTVKDLYIGGSHVLNIAHMALGMASELSELQECLNKDRIDKTNLEEELGDKMWYAANYATFRCINLFGCFSASGKIENPDSLTIYEGMQAVIINGGIIADYAKRWLAYGQKIEDQKGGETEYAVLSGYIYGIKTIAVKSGLDFDEILGRNIVKLYIRYKEKFTSDEALCRDLDAERKSLEKTAVGSNIECSSEGATANIKEE